MSAKIRRTYKGAAISAALGSGGVTSSGQTSITLSTSPSTWPTGKFFVVVAPGTAQEEKMCVTLSGATLTVVDPNVASTSASTNGRGADDTTARSAIAGGSVVYPVFTAVDADEANELTSTYTTQGDLVYQGASTFTRLGLPGTAGHVLKANSGLTAPEWGQVATGGITDLAVTTGKIADTAVTTGKIADDAVTQAKIGPAAVGTTELNDDAVTQAKIGPSAVGTTELNDSSVTLAKLATAVQNLLVPVGTISAYPGVTAPTGWLLCDGTSTTGYTTLAALVGATTPDLRGHTLVGKGSAPFDGALLSKFGSTTSTAAHTHAIDHDHDSFNTSSAGSHTHNFTLVTNQSSTTHSHGGGGLASSPGGSAASYSGTTTGGGGSHLHAIDVPAFTGASGASSAGSTHGNVQPSALVNYIIKHD
jgi:microcystin-dependent protein